MKKAAIALAISTMLAGSSALAADIPVKAPPPAPAPVPTWTGFYAGIQFGGAWGDEAVNNTANDPAAAILFSGVGLGGAPIPSGFRVTQSGPVGGFEAGYNWQFGSNWLLGIEADFSGSGMSGRNSATAALLPGGVFTQTVTAQQQTDWFGTVRGRVGWLATPNLLVFGTGASPTDE